VQGSDGNVGISSSTPKAKLSVEGNTILNGNLEVLGSLVTAGAHVVLANKANGASMTVDTDSDTVKGTFSTVGVVYFTIDEATATYTGNKTSTFSVVGYVDYDSGNASLIHGGIFTNGTLHGAPSHEVTTASETSGHIMFCTTLQMSKGDTVHPQLWSADSETIQTEHFSLIIKQEN